MCHCPFFRRCSFAFVALGLMFAVVAQASGPEIVVLPSVDATIEYAKKIDFWGEALRRSQLSVPNVIMAVNNEGWREEAERMPVQLKKDLFYYSLLPLILHENGNIRRDRNRLKGMAAAVETGSGPSPEDRRWLSGLAARYGLPAKGAESASQTTLPSLLDELLLRVDVIPPALALGQAAYESGYGTSRFALSGNALFGQWTYGGKGIKPKQQRRQKGNYKVASFEWPLDSVRSYVNSLNTHPAYGELRNKRRELRESGKKPSGLALADTLTRYSELGQVYVDRLKSVITHNKLHHADGASLRNEPIVFAVSVDSEEEAAEIRREIQQLRATGELEAMIHGMKLDQ